MAETTTPTTAADETAGRVKRWLIAHPGRAAAARFPIDELWTLLDERAEITAEIVKAHAAVDLLAKRAREAAAERDQLRAELERLRHGAEAPSGRCEDCGCCTASGCRTGTDSTCPTDRLGDSVCPCTGD